MTNKAVRNGIVGIAVVLLVVVMFAGAASADTFEIRTIGDWTTNVTGSNNCILMNDIDFMGGSAYVSAFSGTLDGNGCTIKNFSIIRSSDSNVGVIGADYGCSISNLTISNFLVYGSSHVGGLVGQTFKTSTYENVNIVDGKITCSSGSVGGFVGYGYDGDIKIEGCMVMNCTISCPRDGAGGLVGKSYRLSIYVNDSWVNDCDISGSSGVSGSVGSTESMADDDLYMYNCGVVNCVIESGSGYSGGCIGCNYFANGVSRVINNCTVSNCVIYTSSSSGSSPCGGVIGGCVQGTSPTVYPKVSNCTVEFCTIAGQGSNSAGGIAGTFPTAGSLDRNKVISSCIVSVSGKAAGICPTATTAS